MIMHEAANLIVVFPYTVSLSLSLSLSPTLAYTLPIGIITFHLNI